MLIGAPYSFSRITSQFSCSKTPKLKEIKVPSFSDLSKLQNTSLSILLATFNYRVRGRCVPIRAFHARFAR